MSELRKNPRRTHLGCPILVLAVMTCSNSNGTRKLGQGRSQCQGSFQAPRVCGAAEEEKFSSCSSAAPMPLCLEDGFLGSALRSRAPNHRLESIAGVSCKR